MRIECFAEVCGCIAAVSPSETSTVYAWRSVSLILLSKQQCDDHRAFYPATLQSEGSRVKLHDSGGWGVASSLTSCDDLVGRFLTVVVIVDVIYCDIEANLLASMKQETATEETGHGSKKRIAQQRNTKEAVMLSSALSR